MSRGWRKLLPVKRRMVARSTRRSTVATAWGSDGNRAVHFENAELAVRIFNDGGPSMAIADRRGKVVRGSRLGPDEVRAE